MRTQAQLCHISSDRCVVLVEGFEGSTALGSALGEGRTATEAEDQALARLHARLTSVQRTPSEAPLATAPRAVPSRKPVQAEPQSPATASNAISQLAEQSDQPRTREVGNDSPPVTSHRPKAQPTDPQPPSEAPTDPDDWSEELTAIDLELQRIGWDRDSERVYLERAFGHGSRHRLTRFNDLVAYLKRLRALSPGASPATAEIPLRRSDLVTQSDEILQRLQWSQQQAKDFLQNSLKASSRQQLSDEQLLSFNMMLEEQLLRTNQQ